MITADMVKTGATVIDVGINRMPDGKIAGDVDFESVKEKAGQYHACARRGGPMTITMLLCNTIGASAAQENAAQSLISVHRGS